MNFNNKCEAIFNHNDLEMAIRKRCEMDNKTPKDNYSITLRGGYPTICIAHEHYRIHSLLGNLYYDNYEVIHHRDCNKLNAVRENLAPMTNSEHTKHHHIIDYVPEEHKRGFGSRVAHIIIRGDVTCDKVKELRLKGMTIPQIAEELNCGYNTVCRRIKAIDWSN